MRTYYIYQYCFSEETYFYIGNVTGAKALRYFLTEKRSIRWLSTCGMHVSSANDPFTWYPKYKVFDDEGRERDILEILTDTPKKGEPYRVGNYSNFRSHRFKFRDGPVEGIGHLKWWHANSFRHPKTTQEKRYMLTEREKNEFREEYGITLKCRNRDIPSVWDDELRSDAWKRNRKRNQKKSGKGDWHKTHHPGKSARKKEMDNPYFNGEELPFLTEAGMTEGEEY